MLIVSLNLPWRIPPIVGPLKASSEGWSFIAGGRAGVLDMELDIVH